MRVVYSRGRPGFRDETLPEIAVGREGRG